MSLLVLAVSVDADCTVVRLVGEADLAARGVLADGLADAAALGRGPVLIDVAGVRFCDCSVLAALRAFGAALAAADRGCALVGADPRTRRLIDLAGLADLVDDDAVAPPRPHAGA